MFFQVYLVIIIFQILFSFASQVQFPYPIEASWFSDRYTPESWEEVLQEFSSIGGHIIWQRGRILRRIGADDLQSHPDYQWCFISGVHCVEQALMDLEGLNAKLNSFVIYDYEENYGETILSCPHDRILYSSRVYHILYLPHDHYSSEDPCDIKGKNVDVVMISWSGIDSKEILFSLVSSESSINNIDWEIYISGPYLPVVTKEAWKVDRSMLPATFELTKRIYRSYEERFGSLDSFSGIYQAMETGMSSPYGIDAGIIEAYEFQRNLTHSKIFSKKKKFVISPYVNTNKNQVFNTSIQHHADNFYTLAKLSDVIAVQEGRGCGKNAFYENFQSETRIGDIDPKLEQIVTYLDPKIQSPSFGDTFFFPSLQLFEAFSEKMNQLRKESSTTEFWLNIEAFEYLRNDPCFPIDRMGNGMAEILERSDKWRIDFSLSVESFYVNKITTFAWDYDYQCTTKEYKLSILEEIQKDYKRPIIVNIECFKDDDDCEVIRIFGFQISLNSTFLFQFVEGTEKDVKLKPFFEDLKYGEKNNKSRMMVEVRVKRNQLITRRSLPYAVFGISTENDDYQPMSYHPKYFYFKHN